MPRAIMRHSALLFALFACAVLVPLRSATAQTSVTPVDAAGLKRAIAARKGKVVVVNFWATWCAPCVKEFPDIVRLYDRHRAKGLDLVTVSADMARDSQPKVVPFLRQHRAPSRSAFIQKGNSDTFISSFDPSWQGDVPRTYVYGKDGKLIKVLKGEQTLATFEAAVLPLLAKKG